jgi:competence protein ComEC
MKYMGRRWVALAAMVLLLLTGCGQQPAALPTGQMEVHFIDVGQGDSALIRTEDHAMLIDAGTNEAGEDVVSYLKEQGVQKLDYVVGTHPHEDHIGGLDDVIEAFDVEHVVLPDKVSTTKTYEEVLDAVEAKNLSVTVPQPGEEFSLGEGKVEVLSPPQDAGWDDNNSSVVCRLSFGENSFLFMGDAETQAEKELLKQGADLKSQVLKLGHHGSDTSTSQEFLQKVAPQYGVISVGKGNVYGHPEDRVLQRLEENDVTYFRTDEMGTIVAKSDGQNLSFYPQCKGQEEDDQPQQTEQDMVLITKNGKRYHRMDCGSIKNSKTTQISREEAIVAGYTPCLQCQPE